jgi:hypothetical protein
MSSAAMRRHSGSPSLNVKGSYDLSREQASGMQVQAKAWHRTDTQPSLLCGHMGVSSRAPSGLTRPQQPPGGLLRSRRAFEPAPVARPQHASMSRGVAREGCSGSYGSLGRTVNKVGSLWMSFTALHTSGGASDPSNMIGSPTWQISAMTSCSDPLRTHCHTYSGSAPQSEQGFTTQAYTSEEHQRCESRVGLVRYLQRESHGEVSKLLHGAQRSRRALAA